MAEEHPRRALSKTGHDLPKVPMAVYLFDGKGGVSEVGLDQAGAHPLKGFTVVAGNTGEPEFRIWLSDQLGASQSETMTSPDTASRCTVIDDRATVVMRVVHRRADPDDIRRQSLTLWIEKGRVILASKLHLDDLLGIAQWRQSHHAPVTPADFVARLGLRAADRIEPLVEHVGDVLDELEEEILSARAPVLNARLIGIRRTLITLRRALWPQRDVLNTLEIEDLSFFTARDRIRLREASGRTSRLGEELQALSERAALVHEQILDTRAEQMNKTILVLTAVTVIAMPMTVVSGLLGMNVAGIPFAQNPEAFWFVVVGLAAVGTGMVLFMRSRKWL